MEKQKQASSSTNYRFGKVGRKKQISEFCQFRNEFEKCISQEQISQLKEVYEHGICGRTKENFLVVVDRVGCVKMSEINKILDEESLIGYFNQRMLKISEKILGEKEQLIWVIDLQGKIMQLASRKVLNILTKVIENLQKYFPEVLHRYMQCLLVLRLYLTNTPMLFDTIWNKFCDSIDEATQQKIVMLGDDFDNLYEEVEVSLLPEFLGGELEDEAFLNDLGVQQGNIESVKGNNQGQFGEQEENQFEAESSSSEQQEQVDFSSLKMALGGMKLGGTHLQSNSQTPLNTEADEN